MYIYSIYICVCVRYIYIYVNIHLDRIMLIRVFLGRFLSKFFRVVLLFRLVA